MGKLVIQPSVFALVAVAVLLGRGALLISYLLSVLFHEAAHYLVARKLGYACERLELSAFGAVIYGDYEDTDKELLIIALAGPLANFACCCVCIALWYIVPPLYHFTFDFVCACAVLGITNLLPCYPLDGGKVLCSALQAKLPYYKSLAIAKILTVVCAVLLFAVFFIALVVGQNMFSLGLFAVFLFSCSLTEGKQNYYHFARRAKNIGRLLSRGAELRTLCVNGNVTVARAAKLTLGNALYDVEVTDDNGKTVAYLDYRQWNMLLLTTLPNQTLYSVLRGDVTLR